MCRRFSNAPLNHTCKRIPQHESNSNNYILRIAMDKKRTYLLFAIITLTCAIGNLSQTATNAMLTGIEATFGTPESVSQWLTTIYMLVTGITVPLVVHFAKRFTSRALVLISQVFGLVGTIVGTLAPDFLVLLAARVLQAISTGITLPLIMTFAMTRFPAGKNATAMGIAGIAMGFAPNIGPLIGGALVNTLGWRSFFWIFAIIFAVMIAVTLGLVRKNERETQKAHLDYPSALLSTVGFGGLLLACSNAAYIAIYEPIVWAPLIVGVICIVWFILRQTRIETPLISMRIFKSRTFTVSFVLLCLLFASFMGITLILPLFVTNVSGLTPLDSGMVFLPATCVAIIFNPLSGIASDKLGARPVLLFAAIFLAFGAASMVFMDANTPLWLMAALQGIRGVGVGSTIGPLNSWGLQKLAPDIIMDGSAFSTAVRQACASLGTACMMLLVVLVGGTLGYSLALGLSAVLAICVLVGTVLFVRELDS